MTTIIIKANGPAAATYTDADRVADAALALKWLRYVASYDGWPERAAAYREAYAAKQAAG